MDILSKFPKWDRNFTRNLIGILLILAVVLFLNQDKRELNLNLETRLMIAQGNSVMAHANPSEPEPKVVSKINVITTAYSSTVWETDGDPFITAAGTSVRDGIVANNLLPFGTKIRLPELYGNKIFTVEDRMSSKKGYYHIDIWFASYWEAKNFGAKNTYIEILES